MPCKQWNHNWIAHLYGELESNEQRRLDEHLAGCATCRKTLDELATSGRLLREAAPAVPLAPRVVVLRSGMTRPSLWTFAAGVACALLLIAAGVVTGARLGQNGSLDSTMQLAPSTAISETQPVVSRPEFEAAIRDQQQRFEARLAELEARNETKDSIESSPAMLTQNDLENEIARLQHWIEIKRSADFEYFSQAIAATEARAAMWSGENREAIQYVALKTDPRVSEQ